MYIILKFFSIVNNKKKTITDLVHYRNGPEAVGRWPTLFEKEKKGKF